MSDKSKNSKMFHKNNLDNNRHPAMEVNSVMWFVTRTVLLLIASCLLLSETIGKQEVAATSINYGITQQPITDIAQLMPKLCQNQTMICEGSFCIPGIRKCVCDLRMPVQFGRFCLRQVDIETKCFATSQCNHTIKDAVCIDINSNAILDSESSKFKLDQWQQLNELRQLSQSTLSKDQTPPRQPHLFTTTESSQNSMFLVDSSNNNNFDGFNLEARDDVIISNARNSPYEINYNTPELLSQNHTRRRTNHSDRSSLTNAILNVPPSSYNPSKDTYSLDKSVSDRTDISGLNPTSSDSSLASSTTTTTTSIPTSTFYSPTTSQRAINNENGEPSSLTTERDTNRIYQQDSSSSSKSDETSATSTAATTASTTTTTTMNSYSELTSRKKMIIKSPNWPPGICSCPHGFMFDSMLRKCLTLSLADSHCIVDSDCKQVSMTHCSTETKRCNCDEPLIWNQTELACVRPRAPVKTESSTPKKEAGGFLENLLSPPILARLLPDYTMILLFFVIMVIISTLIILKLTVKCFSSSSSALISPKNKKKKPAQANNLNPRSPYATLRRPDHKPNSQLSNFTQATRGRILNYDFESENPKLPDDSNSPSPLPPNGGTLKSNKDSREKSGTLKSTGKGHKHQAEKETDGHNRNHNAPVDDQLMELNDNISVSQLESESKSENSINIIPGPSPAQQPPYMLRSAMMGQGSAIATAAAAVANKRMQLAMKKNLEQQSSGKLANGSPVYL